MARMLDAVSGSAEPGSTSEQCVEEHNPQPYRVGSEHALVLLSLDCYSLERSLGKAVPREVLLPLGCFPGRSSLGKAVHSSKLKAV